MHVFKGTPSVGSLKHAGEGWCAGLVLDDRMVRNPLADNGSWPGGHTTTNRRCESRLPMDHPAFADTSASRCAYYRRTCGLPAGIHPEYGRIVVKAGLVGAITMPARLGQRARDH